jgi:hypothetical protein
MFEGIKFDLRELNGGPMGVMFKRMVNGSVRYVFYQPCERADCPSGDNWESVLSSMWVCNEKMEDCVDYGIVDENMTIEELPGGSYFNKTIAINLGKGEGEFTSRVLLSCTKTFSPGHIEVTDLQIEKNNLTLSGRSRAACDQYLEPALPIRPNECYFEHWSSDGTIRFNALAFNRPGGYIKNVIVAGVARSPARVLHYSPCGGLRCPVGADCNQYEDAYIWLCEEVPERHTCIPYGLFGHGMSLEPITDSDFEDDRVRAIYRGPNGQDAEVTFRCNPSLPREQLSMIDYGDGYGHAVLFSNGRLTFTITTSDACPNANPTPFPAPFFPPYPHPREPPAPGPGPSPVFLIDNGDSLILVDLTRIDDSVTKSVHMLSAGSRCDFEVFQRAWTAGRCPAGFHCEIETRANWWGCWMNASGVPVCFPMGDNTLGVSLTLREPRAPEQGVRLFVEGYGGIGTDVEIECDPRATSDSFLPLEFEATYQSGLAGANYSFMAKSALVCPISFVKPRIPEPTPSPRPPTSKQDSKLFRFNFENDFSLDLTLFKGVVQNLVVGSDQLFEKVTIKASLNARTGPLAGHSAPYEDANVWKCSDGACIPIGDWRYGINVHAVNKENLSQGVRVKYRGGLGGEETEFVLTCDERLDEGVIALQPIGLNLYPSRVLTIYGQTSQVCKGHILLWRDRPTIGAIAIGAWNALAVFYLIIGVIVTRAREKEIRFPNREFWDGLWDCLAVALHRVSSCSRRHQHAELSQSCESLY